MDSLLECFKGTIANPRLGVFEVEPISDKLVVERVLRGLVCVEGDGSSVSFNCVHQTNEKVQYG